MLRLVSCIAYDHDLTLVGLAALICSLGALVSTHLLGKTMTIRSNARFAWGFIGAIAGGSTIWCTHFVAMLAYQPGIPITYEFGPTFASLMVGIVGCGISFAVVGENIRHAAKIGGAIFGLSVSAMHYTGMMAFATHAIFTWEVPYLIASVILAISISICAFESIRLWSGTKALIGGTGFLVLAIVMLHFTGMTAIAINPYAYFPADYTDDAARSMIAVAVAGVALLVLGTGAVSYFLDGQARSYAAIRLRHLAESAVDGMVVVRDETVVEANTEFLRMTGAASRDVVGKHVSKFLREHDSHPRNKLVRAEVRTLEGALIQVELTIRTETVTDDDHPLTIYALRDISQRLEHEKRISFLAQFDSLTGLRNRTSFLEQTANILDWNRGRAQYAVMAIDLNRFKEVNDTHGHAAGDRVLSETGDRLKTLLNGSQMAARIGGDEFVIFSEIQNREDAVQFAERLEEMFSREIDHEGIALQCGASIGVALAPADGNDITTLLNNADLAMYRAKSSETAHICLYDKSMDDTVRAHRRMIEELRHAIENDELELHYQVQMNVTHEEIAGYEALVRWNHPERGLIPPTSSFRWLSRPV